MFRIAILLSGIAFVFAMFLSPGLSADSMPPASTQKTTDTENQSAHDISGSDTQTAKENSTRLFDLTRTDFRSQFLMGLGYRSDDLKWSIAGDIAGNNPNILSELTWEDLGIFQVEVENRTIIRSIYLRGNLAYGWIFSGDNQDSDYLGDNRTLEFSRSNNSADAGNTFDASVGVGYQFLFSSGFFGITPLVGYSYHEQNLTMTDGNQTLTSPIAPPLGPFPGLDSSYDTQWKGPWLGVDAAFSSASSSNKTTVFDEYELILGFEYHWADYEAEADWNLRTDFAHPKSYEHEADGTGVVLSADLNIYFNAHWALNLNANYQTWETDPGTDRTFFADGTVSETRLNTVEWDSYAVMIGAIYRS